MLLKEKIYTWKKIIKKTMDYITPDIIYVKKLYRLRTGRVLNLKNPRGYSEKLNWLKLYNRKESYTMMADKFAVREYVKNTVGEGVLIPVLGYWNTVEEIDFDVLPEQFVLKCNHDNGVIICRNKSSIDITAVKNELEKHLHRNFYKIGREWPYKNIKRKIICEELLFPKEGEELNDYKFYCFDGKAKVLSIVSGRESNTCVDFFDMEFKRLSITSGYPNSSKEFSKPELFDEMVLIVEKLSANIPHVRVDLYLVKNKIYFGEMTFYANAGFIPLKPEEWEIQFGDWISLPKR